jgi:hypothetical protein
MTDQRSARTADLATTGHTRALQLLAAEIDVTVTDGEPEVRHTLTEARVPF